MTLKVEVPAQKVKDALHNAIVRLQGQARVPGFRPGRAPLDVIQRHFAATARERVVEDLVGEAMPEALKAHGLRPVAPPAVREVSLEEGKPLVFQAVVEAVPKVALKGYKKLQVLRKAHPPSEADVEAQLAQLREGNARLEQSGSGAVAKDDYAVVDFEVLADGKPLKELRASGELVDTSAGHGLDGLPQGLIGMAPGETRDVPVKTQRGPAVARVTVREVKTKILPPLDDDFAKDVGAGSLEELRANIRSLLEHNGKRQTEREVARQLEEALLKANRFPVPPSQVEAALERILERLRRDLLGPRREWPAGEREKAAAELGPRAEEEVRLGYILRAVAEEEKLEVKDEDVAAEIERGIEGARGGERARLRETLEARRGEVAAMLLERKVLSLVRDAASFTEA